MIELNGKTIEECEIFQKIMLPCVVKTADPLASNLFPISKADLLLSQFMKLNYELKRTAGENILYKSFIYMW